jgi:hypothetical protein
LENIHAANLITDDEMKAIMTEATNKCYKLVLGLCSLHGIDIIDDLKQRDEVPQWDDPESSYLLILRASSEADPRLLRDDNSDGSGFVADYAAASSTLVPQSLISVSRAHARPLNRNLHQVLQGINKFLHVQHAVGFVRWDRYPRSSPTCGLGFIISAKPPFACDSAWKTDPVFGVFGIQNLDAD